MGKSSIHSKNVKNNKITQTKKIEQDLNLNQQKLCPTEETWS